MRLACWRGASPPDPAGPVVRGWNEDAVVPAKVLGSGRVPPLARLRGRGSEGRRHGMVSAPAKCLLPSMAGRAWPSKSKGGSPSSQTATSLAVPFHVLQGEAVDLAAFVRRVWEPTDTHPGLSRAASRIDDRISALDPKENGASSTELVIGAVGTPSLAVAY